MYVHVHMPEFPGDLSDLVSFHVVLLHTKQTKHFPASGKTDKHLAGINSTFLWSVSLYTNPTMQEKKTSASDVPHPHTHLEGESVSDRQV